MLPAGAAGTGPATHAASHGAQVLLLFAACPGVDVQFASGWLPKNILCCSVTRDSRLEIRADLQNDTDVSKLAAASFITRKK